MFLYTERFDFRFSWKFVILALMTGFLLSTRSVFVLAYIIFFFSYLWNKKVKFSRLFLYLVIAVLGFFLTFLPLVWLFPQDFLKMNPFIIESGFQAAYIDSLIDISYFILCVPFLLHYLFTSKAMTAPESK